jgi:ubiquinone/menaquinone biosynthesis C-methylase UbiE
VDDSTHYMALLDAFVRGRGVPAEELKVHKFKRSIALPRVTAVLGVLRGLDPTSILDIGSGRGTFLWPLLDAIRGVAVTACDRSAQRAADLQAVSKGGISRLAAVLADVEALPFAARTFDVVTILEVLEHVEDPTKAAAEVLRVARRFVVASVPSHADDNPEHIRLFDNESLERLFADAGASRVTIDYVPGHMIATVTV